MNIPSTQILLPLHMLARVPFITAAFWQYTQDTNHLQTLGFLAGQQLQGGCGRISTVAAKFRSAQQRRWSGQWKDKYKWVQEEDAGHTCCFLSLTGTQAKFSGLRNAGIHPNLTLVHQKNPIAATGGCFVNGTRVCSVLNIVHKNNSCASVHFNSA